MRKPFENLLGLNAKDALAILKSAGIFDVRVTFTAAPAPLRAQAGQTPAEDAQTHSALQGIAGQFSVSDDDESNSYDPMLEPALTDGMLTEARVIGVRDDGRQLIVSRFKVGAPKRREETADD